ncbi:putative platelet-activating factor acetylhydrolase IB gamma subunit [Collimonas arenae]|uniref:Putative platelet-activating factor acetylhydrolase IB gamma subunit n=1 Tax=Collimonas arenae TaxID=279058 RepID=A0A0A1FBC0_9BURK|nr:putative platelet-activating factor acetylhydrolase IB gamma subunit [Collimonas arenae]
MFLFASTAHSAGHYPYYDDRVREFEADKKSYDVVMVGDSITEGGHWSELFPEVRIANRGIGGDSVTGVIDRLPSIRSTGAKYVFLMIGVNDILGGDHTAPQIAADYQNLITALADTGAKVTVQSTLYMSVPNQDAKNKEIEILNQAISRFCRENNINYVDLNSVLSRNQRLRSDVTSDHIHLNDDGYLLWKRKIRPLIDSFNQ